MNNFITRIDQLTGQGSVDIGSATLTLGDTSDFNFFGVLSGTGGISLDQSGAMRLFGNNTYTGQTILANGTLELGSPNRKCFAI